MTMRTTQAVEKARKGKMQKTARQRKEEMKHRRANRRALAKAAAKAVLPRPSLTAQKLEPLGYAAVETAYLAPDNSYGAPDFVSRGFYMPMHFVCKDCGKHEVWTAKQQKWWYENARGNMWTTATRCRECRAKERARVAAAREAYYAGLARKEARLKALFEEAKR
jgi:hypothetical protein